MARNKAGRKILEYAILEYKILGRGIKEAPNKSHIDKLDQIAYFFDEAKKKINSKHMDSRDMELAKRLPEPVYFSLLRFYLETKDKNGIYDVLGRIDSQLGLGSKYGTKNELERKV